MKAADWRFVGKASMGPMLVVPGEPSAEVSVAAIGAAMGDGVGPFAQQGLDEAFGLAIGARRIGPCADVAQAEPAAGFGEEAGDVARAVVGHDALDLDAALPQRRRRFRASFSGLLARGRRSHDSEPACGCVDRI